MTAEQVATEIKAVMDGVFDASTAVAGIQGQDNSVVIDQATPNCCT